MSLNSQTSTLGWRDLALPLGVLGCYWGLLIYYLGAQWSFFEQYNYGWAVPFLCGYLIWQRVRGEKGWEWGEGGREGESGLGCSVLHPSSPILYLLLTFCALAYAPTRLLHEANPIWRLSSWLWAVEVVGITLIVLRLTFGAWRLAQIAFPVCFLLVAVPWPSPVEGFVEQGLKGLDVRITVEALQFFGIPALQRGNVIELATGLLGVEEACSGIRSLQATLMIGLFFGELYALSAMRRALCVLAGASLAFLFNLIRTTFLSLVAAHQGISAVGKWHDSAGVTILLACFASLWVLAQVLKPRPFPPPPRPSDVPRRDELSVSALPSLSSPHKTQLPTVRKLAFALLVWLMVVEVGVELWFHAHEQPVGKPVEWSVDWPQESASFQMVEIDPSIWKMLKFDQGESARWKGHDGSSWQGYFFKWLPLRSLYQRVRVSPYHNPEVCNQRAGWKLRTELSPVSVDTSRGLSLNFRRLVFENEGRIMHLFLSVTEYDQAGAPPSSLRITRWDRLNSALAGSRVYGQRTLEIGVTGIDAPEEAKAALEGQIKRLIKVERGGDEVK